jgi:hypothetical protein
LYLRSLSTGTDKKCSHNASLAKYSRCDIKSTEA